MTCSLVSISRVIVIVELFLLRNSVVIAERFLIPRALPQRITLLLSQEFAGLTLVLRLSQRFTVLILLSLYPASHSTSIISPLLMLSMLFSYPKLEIQFGNNIQVSAACRTQRRSFRIPPRQPSVVRLAD